MSQTVIFDVVVNIYSDVIDDLSCTYNGNQVIKIDDDAVDPVYNGCFNFKDGADEDIEYDYDGNGNLTMDLNREICSISYNCLNLPQRIDYQDGSYVLYTYNARGEKLSCRKVMSAMPPDNGSLSSEWLINNVE